MQARKGIELICFDVDGTLVKHPDDMVIWEVLNIRFGGNREANRRRYDMYHSGKITYDEWVALDVGDWVSAGATREEVLQSVAEFSLVEGAIALEDLPLHVGVANRITTGISQVDEGIRQDRVGALERIHRAIVRG